MHRLAFAGLLLLSLAACHPEQYRVALSPSLQPVDPARPLVRFSQVAGEACGRDALAGAIRDMKRLKDVDGYVEVIAEGTGDGDERCVRVRAYPFRYGDSTDSPALQVGEESLDPVKLPGRNCGCQAQKAEPAAEPAYDCAAACERVVVLASDASIEQGFLRQGCLRRCSADEPSFRACLESASDRPAAKACLQEP